VSPECQSFPGVLSCLSLRDVDWDLVTANMFTLAAIVFFSIIHVPVNVYG
jgi:MFS superfamily sulfate permease-like transporter